jgi:prepilin-type N-terminal cleavage/methylation domain-containing protein
MNRKVRCRLEARGWRKKQSAGFSLFEVLISLALFGLVMVLLIIAGTQAAKMWSESEEQEELVAEGGALLQMICRDLRSASFCSQKPTVDIPLASCQKNIFFLTRTPSNNLVTVGYFLNSSKTGHCYRFLAQEKETLAACSQGTLTELEAHASPDEAHCELIATHLLSWEIIPVWKNEKKLALFEINLAFGKTTPRYFLSTVVALPPAP